MATTMARPTGNDPVYVVAAALDFPPSGPTQAQKSLWFIGPKFTRLSRAGVQELERLLTLGASDAYIGRAMGMTASAAWARRQHWNRARRHKAAP